MRTALARTPVTARSERGTTHGQPADHRRRRPRVDGLDLFEALTDQPRFRNLCVAIYSGRDEPDALDAARKLGACDYIVKGGTWPQTYDRIRACLGAAHASSSPMA